MADSPLVDMSRQGLAGLRFVVFQDGEPAPFFAGSLKLERRVYVAQV